ncbi:hypothetical protein B484DRAFT_443101 [Ochromonadaceae sp. CCMP2298]|nr:hypothetical protein B484DRAFT_443101 [Ochromonadaceae sp. CCMP2298]
MGAASEPFDEKVFQLLREILELPDSFPPYVYARTLSGATQASEGVGVHMSQSARLFGSVSNLAECPAAAVLEPLRIALELKMDPRGVLDLVKKRKGGPRGVVNCAIYLPPKGTPQPGPIVGLHNRHFDNSLDILRVIMYIVKGQRTLRFMSGHDSSATYIDVPVENFDILLLSAYSRGCLDTGVEHQPFGNGYSFILMFDYSILHEHHATFLREVAKQQGSGVKAGVEEG